MALVGFRVDGRSMQLPLTNRHGWANVRGRWGGEHLGSPVRSPERTGESCIRPLCPIRAYAQKLRLYHASTAAPKFGYPLLLRPSKFEGHCPMIRHGCRMALMVALNWSVECVKEES
ncbi:MAG: hypothetical protein BECKG1743D_GA0114223_110642 [Candidatus Kentron sp. G]|nr:MAG: hypothetical protein BECKG1743D_GA0114223_110642 [Candidatus Kentron sp. G]